MLSRLTYPKCIGKLLIAHEQRCLQRIFWRSEIFHELKCFQLNTVTYGTASAPYLAIRCLQQLGLDNRANYPRASKIIQKDFYVDDLITGAATEAEVLQIQREVSSILSSAGFELRKWLCNSNDVLRRFQVNSALESSILQLGENQENKTLGIFWNAQTDGIQYSFHDLGNSNQVTKRTTLSAICQIYDPLGLLGPVIIVAKLIIQELWKLKLGWDETLPQNLHSKWLQLKNDLDNLNNLRIPRHAVISDYVEIELHGFCDSSVQAYGACIYIRCKSSLGRFSSQLLCAKSRVAPLKQITLPRLELCGAVLLSHLAKRVLDSMEIKFDKQYFWSDSTITLAWISGSPYRWKTFVANRVSEIQSLTNSDDWHHVISAENPADLLSRGTNPNLLLKSRLWWNGPVWLTQDKSNWTFKDTVDVDINLLEQRTVVNVSVTLDILNLFQRFSSLRKLQRTVAYICRFINNAKLARCDRQFGPLTLAELETSLNILVKLAQLECFTLDYNNLRKGKFLDNKSPILSLDPYLDDKQLIRVGGRIQNSELEHDRKHPILLPKGHKITELILKSEHERLLHCGAQNLLYSIRERFWPVSGRSASRNIVRKCTVCFRAKPTSTEYLMGNLPAVRVKQFAPFSNVGVDYGGPYFLKDRKTRGAKLSKAYICLFICMCTKAVHLELVSELTTDAFIATLKRFIARRGKPVNIYSDNGLNFVGANNKLADIYSFLKGDSDKITNSLVNEQIKWHFIPARSANFGGMWEAGIKSTKYHIKRVVGNTNLTFEEFATVLAQIEAILNSRPLCPMSSDPQDLTALTPGHFMIGRSLTSFPEGDLTHITTNRLNKFQHLQQLCQHFWTRWHKEYISELQLRTKWKRRSTQQIKEGTLVLIKEENVPSLNWQLGRVIQLHPGEDGVTRVLSIRVQSGVIKRSVTRVCVLPIE